MKKEKFPVDISKVKRHDLTPSRIEVMLKPNGRFYSAVVSLVFRESEALEFPGLRKHGIKPYKIPMRVSTSLDLGEVPYKASKVEARQVRREVDKKYRMIVGLIRSGKYVLHHYSNGRLELEAESSKK